MGRLKDLPLKYQLILIIFSISLASLWVASTAFVLYDRYAYKKNMEYELVVLARILANQNASDMVSGNYPAVQHNIELIGVKTGIVSACITNDSGEIVAQYRRDKYTGSHNNSTRMADCLHNKPYISKFTFLYFDLLQPIVISGSKKIGELHIRQDLNDLNKRFKIFSIVLFLIFLLASIVAIFLSIRVQGFISKPILNLTELADRITKNKNYSLRADPDRKDEVGKLLLAFNSMLDTIDQQNKDLIDAKHMLEEKVDERTAELRNINRELEAFTYSVSHDLRAPLRSIDGFSSALLEDFGKNFDITANDYLARIRTASHRMGLLIDSLLQLSRVSRQELNIEAVNLVSLAEDIIRDLSERFRGQEVIFACPDILLAYGDRTLLMSLMENLLENAWKYSSKIHNARVELGSIERNGETVYFVRDNGAGFDMKYADKLFGPFQRLHRQEDFDGLGIGLATAARIIHRHSGEIWAEGISGEGAVFYFTLKNYYGVTSHA